MVNETPRKRLDADERTVFATRSAEPQLTITEERADPIGVLVGGQPGAGKIEPRYRNWCCLQMILAACSWLTRTLSVRVCPTMITVVAAGGSDTPEIAYQDAGAIAFSMTNLAIEGRRNVLVDGTLANTDRAVASATRFREAEYTVEFHGMAVHLDPSHARTYSRREAEIQTSLSGYGRATDDQFHHDAVKGYRNTVETFYQAEIRRSDCPL